jgi:thiol-disulfide isomerase/thioredoxin
MLMMIKQTEASFSASKQLKALADTTENPFFVIVMPDSLHILRVFMLYAPETVHFVLILNGLNQWETDWLHSRYPGFREIVLKATLKHGRVIDLLIDHFKKPFGMIDSDCFVFNPGYFEQAKVLEEKTLLNAFFCLKNDELDLEIPQTYFLFFNAPIIAEVKKKYRVDSKLYKYKDLRRSIRKSLSVLGIDSEHLPEPATKLIDTIRVVLLLGMIEGYRVNFIKRFPTFSQPNPDMYHIGAVFFNNNNKRYSFYKGSYFWRVSLEKCGDQELIDYYHAKHGYISSQDLLMSNPEFASFTSTKMFVEFVDHILNKQI